MNLFPLINFKSKYQTTLFLVIIIILFTISNVSFSQGRRDRVSGNTNYSKVNQSDTSNNGSALDSLLATDSTRLLPVDSTARIKYFKYDPQYFFGTKIERKSSPLLLENASLIKKEISFDTSGNVIINEKFEGKNIRAPLIIPLEKYISEISGNNLRSVFSDIVAAKFLGNTQDDLSRLLGKFTDITIPLPFKSESIFGPPTFNLKLNGAVDITASYQNSSSDQTNSTGQTTSNNSINFKQEVQLTAKGKVGDKLTIDADYNTQRLFDFENQLKIKYEGYADEVIKKIEGGNVSLETRSGLIGSSQALFGVKGDFQLGALSLSAVVSQKKSKTEEKNYSGGAQEQVFDIKAWDYSENHYFLDTVYKQSFLNYYNSVSINQSTDSLAVNEQNFEVWVQTDVSTNGYRKAGLHVDLPVLPPSGIYDDTLKTVSTPQQGLRTFGIVRKLGLSEYSLNRYAGFISLKINIPENFFVGVAYKRTRSGEAFGTISTDSGSNATDTLVLKMIKVQNVLPENTLAWELKMKNIYRLPVSRVVKEGFEFDVKYSQDNVLSPSLPTVSTPLIQILGLDRYTSGRTGGPDNKFDFIPGVTIDPEGGFIIFPTLKPFLDNLAQFNVTPPIDSSFWYPQIYTDLKRNASLLPNANKYSLIGRARGETGLSNTINLGFNIVHGSVKVKVGEIVLNPNTAYSVDYSTGIVVIKDASALLSKDLKVTYETNDLFTLASKTFLGLRGDYKISDKSSLGFTYVNLKQETLNDKVRIGEEPTNNSMFGIDFSTEIKTKFLTNLVNLLPGYNTKEPSSITIRGELAAITPDPNTKKSKIPQDNNEAVAYIDDMEGAKKNISLGTSYNSWTMASVPLDVNNVLECDTCRFLKQAKRGRLKWYNLINNDLLTNIFPLKDVQSTQNNITPFYITYIPYTRGTYNYNGKFDTIADKRSTWNGVMKYLNTTSNDLINENINFIEFSMRVDRGDSAGSDGKLIIDL
ncbi:MAG: cell surface protein SprA, partial [Ignavibacteria bacterium]